MGLDQSLNSRVSQTFVRDGGAMVGWQARFIGEVDWKAAGIQKYLTYYPKDHDAAHEVALAHAQWKDWDGAVAWCDAAPAAEWPEK